LRVCDGSGSRPHQGPCQREAGRSQGPICESLGTDSSDSSSGDGPYRPFWQDARKFFFRGESGVPQTSFAWRARVRHAVKKQRRRPHIKMTHHRNAHLTVVFCNLRIIPVERCGVRQLSRLVSARQRLRRVEGVREDVTSTSPRCERFFFLSACSNRDAVPAIRAGA
jgi:hypothetical protein